MSIDGLPGLFLVVHDGRQEAVEVLILAVIMLVELLKAVGQVGAKHHGWIVPFERPVIQVQLMLSIVREAGELL